MLYLVRYCPWCTSKNNVAVIKQKLCGFLRRSFRLGFYSQDLSSFDDLRHQTDNSMFRQVLHNSEHVLHSLLPLFLTPCTISENVHMIEYCSLIVFFV